MHDIVIKQFSCNVDGDELDFIAFPSYPEGWPCVSINAISGAAVIGTVIFRIPVIRLIEFSNNGNTWEEIISNAVCLFHERDWPQRLAAKNPADEGHPLLDSF